MNSVRLNEFGLAILDTNGAVEKTVLNGANYFALPHKSEYKLKLINNHCCRCDVKVDIDGEMVGTWRLGPYASAIIERPTKVHRKFTFLKEYSKEAQDVGINFSNNQNGLVSVTFYPEKKVSRIASCNHDIEYLSLGFKAAKNYGFSNDSSSGEMSFSLFGDSKNISDLPMTDSYCSSATSTNYSSGATVLGDSSNQRFRKVSPLTEIDQNKITTINIRLVVDNDKTIGWQPYVSLNKGLKEPDHTKVPPKLNSGWFI